MIPFDLLIYSSMAFLLLVSLTTRMAGATMVEPDEVDHADPEVSGKDDDSDGGDALDKEHDALRDQYTFKDEDEDDEEMGELNSDDPPDNEGDVDPTAKKNPKAAAKEKKPEKPAPKDAAEPKVSDTVRAQAKSCGFNDSEIESWGSDDAARGMIAAFDRRMAEIGGAKFESAPDPSVKADDKAKAKADEAPKKDGAADKATERPGEKQGGERKSILPKFELKLAEDFDPELRGQLGALNDHYAGQMDMVVEAITKFATDLYTMINETTSDQFDGVVSSLPDEYVDVFGKGTRHDFAPDSDHFKNRSTLREQVKALAAGYEKNGMPRQNLRQLVERMAFAAFGSKLKQSIEKKVASTAKERGKRVINRPASKQAETEQLSDQERAEAFVENFFKDRGITDEDDDLE